MERESELYGDLRGLDAFQWFRYSLETDTYPFNTLRIAATNVQSASAPAVHGVSSYGKDTHI